MMLFVCLLTNVEQKANGKPSPPHNAGLFGSSYLKDSVVLTSELINFNGASVLMLHNNKMNEETIDTLPVIKGRFTVPVDLIPRPQIVTFFIIVDGQFNGIKTLLAPGYQLSLKADVNNWTRRNMKIHWDGTGSVINNFYTEINQHLQYYDPSGKESFDSWYQRSKITTDSLFINCTRLYNDSQDDNYAYFKNLIYSDVNFNRLNELLGYAYKLLVLC
ncbi:hypothetical protein BDD43_0662 [Mucilaginibacter gracilis]|uniref:Uncharacterized protein n=2 Tax=Mucilaginibacter gracilis TaxID=423350 RepID=A0A495IW25_9SPHI|nr:hypothetical protein BDD43_0662 [Mucilaginibacter gracilis]